MVCFGLNSLKTFKRQTLFHWLPGLCNFPYLFKVTSPLKVTLKDYGHKKRQADPRQKVLH